MLRKFRRRTYFFTSEFLNRAKRFFENRVFLLDQKIGKSEILEELDELFKCKDKFLACADEYVRKLPAENIDQADLVRKYFVLKNLVAEHESRHGTLPVQLFNEHRMAFDHMIRGLIQDEEVHAKKKIDHIDRATLDVLKLNCHGLCKDIIARHKKIPAKALGIISDGEYIKKYTKLQVEAETLLYKAKCEEYKLNSDTTKTTTVIELFIEGYLAHRRWHDFQTENLQNSLYITVKYYSLSGMTLLIAVVLGLISSLIASCIFAYFTDSKFKTFVSEFISR